MSKYNNRKTELDGYKFDSAAEARRYLWLKDELEQGNISFLHVHERYTLIDKSGKKREVAHEVDFSYWDDLANKPVVEDVKGVSTALWKLKHRLFVDRYPHIEYRVIPAKDC